MASSSQPVSGDTDGAANESNSTDHATPAPESLRSGPPIPVVDRTYCNYRVSVHKYDTELFLGAAQLDITMSQTDKFIDFYLWKEEW